MRTDLSRIFRACILSITLIIFLGLAPNAWASDGDNKCDDFTGAVLSGSMTSQTMGVSQGTATIGDKNYTFVSNAMITGFTPNPDGSLSITATHKIFFYNGEGELVGSISTMDMGTFSPTAQPGIFDINDTFVIVSGTDRFNKACGKLSVHVTLNAIQNTTTGTVTGSVCKCND
jgi:hypothetical protein